MSEPLTKQRPTVDLDQFERDMHTAAPYHDDPLAELARLVGEQHDPYGDVFAREAAVPVAAAEDLGRREPAFAATAPMSPRLSGDFAAIEAGLRSSGAQHHSEPTFDPAFASHDHQNHAYHEGAAPEGDYAGYDATGYDPASYDPNWTATQGQPPRPARTRRPAYLIAATIAVGVLGIGTAFALKGHLGTSPREVKTILADSSPTKVQPPADAADQTAAQDTAVLGKTQPAPTSLASHEEQPVDVASAVQDRRTDADSVPVPPTPSQVAMADPSGAAGQNFPLADMPAPKRVRVVSVKPDGTILPNDNPPPSAVSAPRLAPAKTSDKAGPVAKPSTPKTAAKSTSRVTTPKSVDQLASVDDAGAPAAAPAKPAPKKAKPQRVASADTGTQEATAAISPDPAAAGAGGFAVQLAAPGSEADAKATSSKLAKKFAGPLGSHHLAFHKADSNGKSVYRVRVSSLSRTDAVSLCEKLKADGGSCFVAKN